jgi:hypothetical protein
VAASAQCASLQCGSDEMVVPRIYGEYGPEDTCVCSPNVWSGENEASDRFGAALAVGDFDGDLLFDLAVGAYGETSSRGVVYIYRGSPSGLRFWKRIAQHQLTAVNYQDGTTPAAVSQQPDDQFGVALAAGDYNQDGFADLLVGAPGDGGGSGAVFLLPGSAQGPDTQHVQHIDQRESGGVVEVGDRFGESLTTGDFNGDGRSDFAVGAPQEVSGGSAVGAVSIHLGRAVAVGAGSFETSDGIRLGTGANHEFGYALAAGDMDGDGSADLLIGSPGNNSVYRMERTATWGLSQTLTQSTTRFGEVLAMGDFISHGMVDLAVGTPHHSSDKGAIFTYRGNSGGAIFAQTIVGNETDELGASLCVAFVVGDATANGKGDLLAGRIGEAVGSGPREGFVSVFSGVTVTQLGPATDLDQSAFNLGGVDDALMQPEHHGTDRFGAALVAVPNVVGRIFGIFQDTVAVGASTDTVDGNKSGSVFTFVTTQPDRKIDQVTMSHQSSW